MTTLSALKSQIVDDLARTDLTTPIADAITASINFYKPKFFYFNQSRAATFSTVADQSSYGVGDDADIPLFVKIDEVFITDSGSNVFPLKHYQHERMEVLLDTNAATGRSFAYSYYEKKFYLYSIPDAVYTIRPTGLIERAAPATDGEADNVWMTEAFELLRCRAKAYLYLHTIHNSSRAMDMQVAERQALTALREGNARTRRGQIEPTQF